VCLNVWVFFFKFMGPYIVNVFKQPNKMQCYTMVFITMLYIFKAVPPPIIRSSKLYTQHRVFVEIFLLLTTIVIELEMVCMCCWTRQIPDAVYTVLSS